MIYNQVLKVILDAQSAQICTIYVKMKTDQPIYRVESVRASEQNALIVGSSPTQANYSYFKESFSGEYHEYYIYIYIYIWYGMVVFVMVYVMVVW